jgi:peptide subunit release factor RF-3
VIQDTGNEQLGGLIKERLASGEPIENRELLNQLLTDLKEGRRIEGRLSPMHYGIAQANFTKREIEQALAAQAAARYGQPASAPSFPTAI